MKKNFVSLISIMISVLMVLGSFPCMASALEDEEKTVLIDTLHGGATANGAELAFDGDEVHTQNGASVTVAKDSGNTGYSTIKKYTGDKLTFHGVSDSASNGNSGIKISFADGTNNTEGCKRYLEFTINTNAKGRTYAKVLAGETTLFSHWASGDLVDNTNHVIRVEIDRTGDVPVAKLLLDGTEKTSKNLTTGSEEISIWLASYKTPTITISNVEYGKIGTPTHEDEEESSEDVLIDTLHGGATADGAELAFNGDEVHTQNGATVTVAKDSGNDGYSIIKKYTGDKLTFHGVSDGASNGNSGIKISFADGTNNTEGCKRYLEFTINTNAKGRTYAKVLAGETTLFSHWASGDLVDNTNHVIRVEIDRTGDTPIVKLLLDGTEKTSKNLTTGSEEISIWLASYKTPIITISNVEYGKIGTPTHEDEEESSEAVLIDTFHGGATADGAKIAFDGDEVHTQNDATVTVKKSESHADTSFIMKYTGDKLTYHGANDAATNGNSFMDVVFSPGTNDVTNSLVYLEFDMMTNAPTRTYALINLDKSGNLYQINWAGSNLTAGKVHKFRVEIDKRIESISNGYAVARIYKDGDLLVEKNVSLDNNDIVVGLGAYKTPTITLSNVKYGKTESNEYFGIKAFANSDGSLRVFASLSKESTCSGTSFIAVYAEGNELIALMDVSDKDQTYFETTINNCENALLVKAFTWVKNDMKPLDTCKEAEIVW